MLIVRLSLYFSSRLLISHSRPFQKFFPHLMIHFHHIQSFFFRLADTGTGCARWKVFKNPFTGWKYSHDFSIVGPVLSEAKLKICHNVMNSYIIGLTLIFVFIFTSSFPAALNVVIYWFSKCTYFNRDFNNKMFVYVVGQNKTNGTVTITCVNPASVLFSGAGLPCNSASVQGRI